MRGKSGLMLGLAIGYVFGTKAGRERYEQLSQSAKRLAADPSLQRLQAELGGLFSASRQQLSATVEGTARGATSAGASAGDSGSTRTSRSSGSSSRSSGSGSSSKAGGS